MNERIIGQESLNPEMAKNAFILIGPPTSGKTSQTIYLEETTRGHKINGRDVMPELAFELENERSIIPDELFVPRLKSLLAHQIEGSIIMDNIPRTASQARALTDWAEVNNVTLNVIKLDLNEEEVVERASLREVCSKCNEPYHPLVKPSKSVGICDRDGTKLKVRAGDKENTVRKGFAAYREMADSVIDELLSHANFYDIPASGNVSDVSRRMFADLSETIFYKPEMSEGYYKLRDALEQLKVRHLFFSGMPVYMYGGRALMKDFDILVPGSDIASIANLLDLEKGEKDSSVARTSFVDIAPGVEINSSLVVKAAEQEISFDFEFLWEEATTVRFMGLECQIMSVEDLILLKAALGRFGPDDWGKHKDDLSDIEGLAGVQTVDWEKLSKRSELLKMKNRLLEKLSLVNVEPKW